MDRLSAGLVRLADGAADVILLDLSLPDSSGMETLERKHALVVGGSRGFGRGIVEELLAAGAKVNAVARGVQAFELRWTRGSAED